MHAVWLTDVFQLVQRNETGLICQLLMRTQRELVAFRVFLLALIPSYESKTVRDVPNKGCASVLPL